MEITPVSVMTLPIKNLPESVQKEIAKIPELSKYLESVDDDGKSMPFGIAYAYRVFDPHFNEFHLPLLEALLPYLTWYKIWSIFLSPVQGNCTTFREIILEHFLQRNPNLTAKELKLIGSNSNSNYKVVPMVLSKLTKDNLKGLRHNLPSENEISLIGFYQLEKEDILKNKAWAETCQIFYDFGRKFAEDKC
jgi:hypothetical protein